MSRWEIRRSGTRGTMHTGWLQARFSFSFAGHLDPQRPRFGPLVALNEDRVQPGTGFPMHPHRDLEIVMLPRSGAVEHRDSAGRHMVLRPGELQWMRAGSGIRHRQWNASADQVDHHFQIWFAPSVRGMAPAVERLSYAPPGAGDWRTLVSPRGDEGSLDIGVDVVLALGRAAPGRTLEVPARAPGGLYLHAMDGDVDVSREGLRLATLEPGDAIVFFDDVPELQFTASSPADLLRFDTAPIDPLTGSTASPPSFRSTLQEALP